MTERMALIDRTAAAAEADEDHRALRPLHRHAAPIGGVLPRLMAALARAPARAAHLGGAVALCLVVLADSAVRAEGIRLVPLYVPILCVICWALGRWPAVLFAAITTIVAILPDMVAATEPLGIATAANAAIRMVGYIFLALIIVAYRRTYDEADLRAMYDGLTGVLNKVSFHAAAAQYLAAARRTQQTLLVLYADLDGFKAVNTDHGHAAGDAALRSFASDAREAIRGSDLVGRLGGDEFGFLIGATSVHSALALAHLLHQRFTTTLAKTGLPLSCSMGALVVPPRSNGNEAELLDAADHIMRRAKADGKGKVVTEVLQAQRDPAAFDQRSGPGRRRQSR